MFVTLTFCALLVFSLHTRFTIATVYSPSGVLTSGSKDQCWGFGYSSPIDETTAHSVALRGLKTMAHRLLRWITTFVDTSVPPNVSL
uniref:Putative secreted protein n=1 Tax=Anopheles darlingi TaxID=43151 RepID=A0A2M4DA79_ANODA